MSRFLIALIFILISCSKKSTEYISVEYIENNYKDFFISQCFFYYLDDKTYKERFDCGALLFLDNNNRTYLDSLVVSLQYELNDHIINQSEGMTSMYLYGKNNLNILEDSLKRIRKYPNLQIDYPPNIVVEPINEYAHHSAPPTYFCVTQACMKVVRSKEFEKMAYEYAKKRIKEHKAQMKLLKNNKLRTTK
ncbi:MAG: hypothetical protein IPO92_16775 [Saprospiraceae bacterium]|nr:hypothetical protein [Saprospiraceae bacterium]